MRCIYEQEELYSFEEVMSCLIGQTGGGTNFPFNELTIRECLSILDFIDDNSSPKENTLKLPFVVMEDNLLRVTDLGVLFFNKLFSRYEHHLCFALDDIYLSTDTKMIKATNNFIKKVVNKLDYSYPRYSTLLSLYEDEKTHLMDGLERARSGSRSLAHNQANSNNQNSKQLYNDSPQSSDVIATIDQNQFVSEITKGQVSDSGEVHSTGSDEFSETETFDTKTIMSKLDEIERQFVKIWERWLNEFDELFIEEVNY